MTIDSHVQHLATCYTVTKHRERREHHELIAHEHGLSLLFVFIVSLAVARLRAIF